MLKSWSTRPLVLLHVAMSLYDIDINDILTSIYNSVAFVFVCYCVSPLFLDMIGLYMENHLGSAKKYFIHCCWEERRVSKFWLSLNMEEVPFHFIVIFNLSRNLLNQQSLCWVTMGIVEIAVSRSAMQVRSPKMGTPTSTFIRMFVVWAVAAKYDLMKYFYIVHVTYECAIGEAITHGITAWLAGIIQALLWQLLPDI